MSSKRKTDADSPEPSKPQKRSKGPKNTPKKQTTLNLAAKGGNIGKSLKFTDSKTEWPEYFHSLFKIFKALNTVIAFCSSRQHVAITFTVIRTSVEGLLRHPLELSKVAEIKALLPELVRFAYIPSSEHRIHSDRTSGTTSGKRIDPRRASPDIYEQHAAPPSSEEGQVLILEFVDSSRMKKNDSPDGPSPYSTVPTLTPQDIKKLIEKRNDRFVQAVDELLVACKEGSGCDDPVSLVVGAARDHIPLDPSVPLHSATTGLPDPHTIPDPKDRASIEAVITEIESSDEYRSQVVGRRIFEAREAVYCQLQEPLSKSIETALLQSRNLTGFYGHQAAAINAISQGMNVIVSTGTASGKSVIYQVPVLRFLEEDADATAMFIFPTKALAQDQKATLVQLLTQCPGLEHVQVATYDGDTPQEERRGWHLSIPESSAIDLAGTSLAIRDKASVIFTNFDMLHAAILPHEDLWRRFIKNMKMVVVDELHYYSGLLGSHVAFIMRRFRRICTAVGNRRPRFVSCSATVANPKEHMETIFGVEDVAVVTEDTSPAGRKDFLIWNPPLIDPLNETGGRVSPINEACALFQHLMAKGIRTILFCKIRKTCELVMKTVRAQLASAGRSDILSRVRAYRGGYSQQDRRKIEKEAFSGGLLGIVATNALELGVDIGSLDAVIILGFPYSVASLRQQAGRAGRRSKDSLAVLVLDRLPVDQHFAKNPDEVFDKPMADLVIDLTNPVILEGHLQCAANEMPLSLDADSQYFGPLFHDVCKLRLTKDQDGSDEVKYTVVDVTHQAERNGRTSILEEVEISRAIFETYEGGIFMHQGQTFLVREVSHDDRTARVVQTDVNWTTRPRDFTDIDPVQTLRIREIRKTMVRAFYGHIHLSTVVFGFFKLRNNQILDAVDLDTPPFERESMGFWVDLPNQTLALMRRHGLNPAEGLHAAAHVVLSLAPLFALASGGDIRTECKVPEKEFSHAPSERKRPARLTFFDAAGKGSGVSARAFDHVSDLLYQALERLESCECEEGCPSCIRSPSCTQGNLVASKVAARVVLQGILSQEIDESTLPVIDESYADLPDTVVEATSIKAVDGVRLEVESAQ